MERMKMANQDKLERMKNDVISNMDKEKLKKYLYYLTRKYYETYMKGDDTHTLMQESWPLGSVNREASVALCS